MPEAVCDSHKSGVERNVLGRLLTFIYFVNRRVVALNVSVPSLPVALNY